MLTNEDLQIIQKAKPYIEKRITWDKMSELFNDCYVAFSDVEELENYKVTLHAVCKSHEGLLHELSKLVDNGWEVPETLEITHLINREYSENSEYEPEETTLFGSSLLPVEEILKELQDSDN